MKPMPKAHANSSPCRRACSRGMACKRTGGAGWRVPDTVRFAPTGCAGRPHAAAMQARVSPPLGRQGCTSRGAVRETTHCCCGLGASIILHGPCVAPASPRPLAQICLCASGRGQEGPKPDSPPARAPVAHTQRNTTRQQVLAPPCSQQNRNVPTPPTHPPPAPKRGGNKRARTAAALAAAGGKACLTSRPAAHALVMPVALQLQRHRSASSSRCTFSTPPPNPCPQQPPRANAAPPLGSCHRRCHRRAMHVCVRAAHWRRPRAAAAHACPARPAQCLLPCPAVTCSSDRLPRRAASQLSRALSCVARPSARFVGGRHAQRPALEWPHDGRAVELRHRRLR